MTGVTIGQARFGLWLNGILCLLNLAALGFCGAIEAIRGMCPYFMLMLGWTSFWAVHNFVSLSKLNQEGTPPRAS